MAAKDATRTNPRKAAEPDDIDAVMRRVYEMSLEHRPKGLTIADREFMNQLWLHVGMLMGSVMRLQAEARERDSGSTTSRPSNKGSSGKKNTSGA